MPLSVFTSTAAGGNMKSPDYHFEAVLPARQKFLERHHIDIQATTLVHLTYETTDFCRYFTVNKQDQGDGMIRESTLDADALVTTTPGQALFLPLADCIGAVIYDPTRHLLMLSHLGRHNLEQSGGTKSIEYLLSKHRSNPADLTVWLSPAAGKKEYPLFAFQNRSLHEVAIGQLTAGGILPQNISVSPINSATDLNYFSHSQFLKGNQETDGRFAVAAILTP